MKDFISPWSAQADRGRQRELKREAVLRCAAQAFSEKGFHETSLDEVAERLNVSKPTLYYYVRNKEQILIECARIGFSAMTDARSAAASADNGAARLTLLLTTYAGTVINEFGRCAILVGEDPLSPEGRDLVRGLKRQIDLELRKTIEDGIADGSIRLCDPKIAAFTLAGALNSMARWYDPQGALSADELIEQSVDLLVRGLCAPAQQYSIAAL